ncbi:MAG TPA: SUMF1/EgtB/PvdO family nonheme iron enzyme [Candidatus Acidoferrum sp.]|nr:SUMF1/EgtB/PvdO family nonheme iron enzyme [Candidatus Acidoferrum sp.]
MSKLFEKLAKTGPAQAAEGVSPRLTLAAFGKHPGWDDHMPGIGVDTESLAYIKQTLYVTGIGRQIDSGAWEKLEPEKRQEGFDHTFLLLRAGHVVLGQLWSSKDGKGRAKYPMVLCVDGERVSPRLMLSLVRPGLQNLRDACKAAATADQVAGHCRAAQEELRKLFIGGTIQAEPNQPGDEPRLFLERAELGPDRLGLLRVMHELSGSFDTAGGTRVSAHGGGASPQSLHFRVPLAADTQDSAFLLWAGFVRAALSSAVPLVLFARGQADWLDLVAGEPKGDDFFFLQASRKGFPLVTEIPYQVAPNAMAALREIEAQFVGGEPPAPQVTPDGTAKAAPPAPLSTPPRAETPVPRSRRTAAVVAGSVVVVLIAALLLLLPMGKTGNQRHFDELVASGKAFIGEKKYDEAIHDLEEAGKLHPQDAQIIQFLGQARQQRDAAALAGQYEAAMSSGRGAFARGDYTNALAQAGKALLLKPDEGDAKKLHDDAQTKLAAITLASRNEADYQSAMSSGRGAFARGDYTNALAQAGKALLLKPDDGDAKKLHDDAQTKLAAITLASRNEADYQSAMSSGRGAFARGDYTNALAQAGKALLLKPDDGDAKKLRDDAKQKLGGGGPPQLFTNSIGMEFVWVPDVVGGGAFVGKYEVTKPQYQKVMGGLPNGQALDNPNLPVTDVTFDQARQFCEKLSQQENKHYTLPTKQQWLSAIGLSEENVTNAWDILKARGALDHEVTGLIQRVDASRPSVVGSMGAESNGVCDMLGNVREWVSEPQRQQRAGFSFRSKGAPGTRTGNLFLPGPAPDDRWIELETGFRCFLTASQSP